MSFQAMAWAVDQPVTGIGKLILLLLANYAGRDGICFPSQEELAKQAGITDRAVRTWLSRFEESGLISREKRYRKNGTRGSDLIVINLPEPRSASKNDYRNQTTRLPEPRSAYSKEEPITEPITKRPLVGKKNWEALSATIAPVITKLDRSRQNGHHQRT